MRFKAISKGYIFVNLILFFMINLIKPAFGEEVILRPVKPDSITVQNEGEDVRIRWYPAPDSITTEVGTKFYDNWNYMHETDGVEIEFIGAYKGFIDRELNISLANNGVYHVASAADGGSGNIDIIIEFTDKFWVYNDLLRRHQVKYETYQKRINIGYFAQYGDTIPLVLMSTQTGADKDLGLSIYFKDGYVDTTEGGTSAYFSVDLQTYEGFHVWRKGVQNTEPDNYPSQTDMTAISEISKEEYYLYSKINRTDDIPNKRLENWEYFNDRGEEMAYPRVDSLGGKDLVYYEWLDKNVFPGFKYYYSVTSYDRGFYRGSSKDSVSDNFVCDNDSIPCSDVMEAIWVGSPATGIIDDIYAVPNPFRTGSSAQTTPYYHNYEDGDYVKFFNIPPQAKLRIFTISGDLVWKAVNDNSYGGEGIIKWNAENMEGQQVTSGVFIYRCEDTNGEDTYGKVIVIR